MPSALVASRLEARQDALCLDGVWYAREAVDEVVVVGAGKAVALMGAQVLADLAAAGWRVRGALNVPHELRSLFLDALTEDECLEAGTDAHIGLTFAAHPVPDEAGVRGAREIEALVREAGPRSLVLVLLSGGGSALLPSPCEPLTLEQLQETTRLLLASGARIEEVNTVRKHLETLKGGQLARLAARASVAALHAWVLSDVIGDDLATVASGPCSPDDTTYFQAVQILQRRGVDSRVSSPVWWHLTRGLKGKLEDLPREEDTRVFDPTRWHTTLIGSVALAAAHITRALRGAGWHTHTWTTRMNGEARVWGKSLLRRVDGLLQEQLAVNSTLKRLALIATGELTVTLTDTHVDTLGTGGRNQEALLALLLAMHACAAGEEVWPTWCAPAGAWTWCIVGAAYDGLEGNSAAMGAVLGPWSLAASAHAHAESALAAALARHDAHGSVFGAHERACCSGDALQTGATATNVNDLWLILLERRETE